MLIVDESVFGARVPPAIWSGRSTNFNTRLRFRLLSSQFYCVRLLFAMIKSLLMARRPDAHDDAFDRTELEELRNNLSHLSPTSVIDFYRTAHRDCAPERKPGAKAIQQLVTAWKILRKWKWR